MATLEALSSISAQAARLAIQVDAPDHVCPLGLTLTAQSLLDQDLGPVEVETILHSMMKEHNPC
jgi:hypothetical protein